ncbi:peptidoglycan-binding protein [Patescibacteria group bacterium]|nr:peptidoglycan-binding protein [Patescibacteria group bacterium]
MNSDPDTQVAESGAGSPGLETNYFGSLTERAVQKFQAKYGIVSSGTPGTTGYGRFGPKTHSKLAEISSN